MSRRPEFWYGLRDRPEPQELGYLPSLLHRADQFLYAIPADVTSRELHHRRERIAVLAWKLQELMNGNCP